MSCEGLQGAKGVHGVFHKLGLLMVLIPLECLATEAQIWHMCY